MRKFVRVFCAGACVLPSACATPGGGAAGISMLDPNQHVAAATALDGPDLGGGCFSNVGFMLAVLSGGTTNLTFRSPTCAAILAETSRQQLVPLAGRPNTNIDNLTRAMVFVSEERCNAYVSFLQTYQGNVSSIFGIGSQVASLIGALTTGGTANVFSGIGGTIAGAGSTLNKSTFHDKALELIAAGFMKRRARIRDKIDAGLKSTEANYPASEGLNDARDYHSACSLSAGFQELASAVSEAPPTEGATKPSTTTGDNGNASATSTTTGAAATTQHGASATVSGKKNKKKK